MTYCDFKPGDEVVCVERIAWDGPAPRWMFWTRRRLRGYGPKKDHVYVVEWVGSVSSLVGGVGLEFAQWPNIQWASRYFRKVQRRDLSAWLETSTDFEEPKRVPVKEPA
jgi:hypothetical protein